MNRCHQQQHKSQIELIYRQTHDYSRGLRHLAHIDIIDRMAFISWTYANILVQIVSVLLLSTLLLLFIVPYLIAIAPIPLSVTGTLFISHLMLMSCHQFCKHFRTTFDFDRKRIGRISPKGVPFDASCLDQRTPECEQLCYTDVNASTTDRCQWQNEAYESELGGQSDENPDLVPYCDVCTDVPDEFCVPRHRCSITSCPPTAGISYRSILKRAISNVYIKSLFFTMLISLLLSPAQ